MMSTATPILFGVQATAPAVVALAIHSLPLWEHPLGAEQLVDARDLGDLFMLAKALEKVEKGLAGTFYRQLSFLETAMGLRAKQLLGRAKDNLTMLVEHIPPFKWGNIVARLQTTKASDARFSDDILPYAMVVLAKPALERPPAKKDLNPYAVQEWPPGSKRLFIPEEEDWARQESFDIEYIKITIHKGNIVFPFLIQEYISGSPIEFIFEQTDLLNSLVVSRDASTIPETSELTSALELATRHEDLTRANRFLIRSVRLSNGEEDQESFWVGVWGYFMGEKRPQLLVYIPADQTFTGKPAYVPFKDFVSQYVSHMHEAGNDGMYRFEPVCVHCVLEKMRIG